MKSKVIIETSRTSLMMLGPNDASLMVEYYCRNKQHLAQWEPKREPDFYGVGHWKAALIESYMMYEAGSALKLVALNKERSEVIGVCNFTNIIGGIFQACNLGYGLSEKYQGQGYMQEILEASIEHMFSKLGLHRIMANYIPTNLRSEALLTRLGFEKEGLAKSYLKINGKWQDHILTAKVNHAQD
ncbi:GNAT family N-acetyltransferase [Shewanella mesophila]|uniref:GNAT family N-acetyltransferase n=1 Tax=Shewanella mesophila TaxID=2864208 RepID=UPI001C65570C|nr:GNAT family N-acetyltransferase [Shewanella mesophila]QYJ86787.1 GNAT family N-acetyltransferase [Shewanella mesophila]